MEMECNKDELEKFAQEIIELQLEQCKNCKISEQCENFEFAPACNFQI